MKTRYFYHMDEEKIYTLSELEKLYNAQVIDEKGQILK